ncbi:MAG: PCMD domain-containing protein [Bacteroides sp.]|nr:PCMD domain-containing protein [Bacteroides sp.]MDD3038700.1 PCMD domain-containing protein [Bacteroides sp.]
MKKNLLYLCALVCTASLFVACSSDDDNGKKEEPPTITAPAVVGTYRGNMDITMTPDGSDQEMVIADGLMKNITISQVSDTEVKMELKEFELFINGTILKLGDIVVDKCVVKKDGTSYNFTGQQNLTFQGAGAMLGTCATTVDGDVEGGDIDMDILVKVPALSQTVKVSFDGVKLVTDAGTYYNFETWVPGVEGQEPDMTFYEPTGWSSSNTGAHFLKGMHYVDRYVVTQTNDAHWGKSAAKIETLDSKGADAGFAKIPKVTTGSLFLGAFKTSFPNTLESTKFGIEFSKKPLSLKGYYKYAPGENYYVCQSIETCDIATVDATQTDAFSIKAVLYITDEYKADYSDCLTGADIYTSNRVVATASLEGGAQANWTFFDITLNYKKPYDANQKYRFAIICSSSKEGDKFCGAPGSVLIVDDFELISAE